MNGPSGARRTAAPPASGGGDRGGDLADVPAALREVGVGQRLEDRGLGFRGRADRGAGRRQR